LAKKKKRKAPPQKKQAAPAEPPVQEQPAEPRKKKIKKPSVPRKLTQPNWVLTGLAGAGMALTAYLVLTTWLGKPPLLCSEGSSCDIVQQSRWGTFLGMPTALWGFLTYASLLFIGIKVRDRETHWKAAWTISLIGLAYSIYLITISMVVIEAACVYCLISFSLMTVIFGVATFQRPKDLPGFSFTGFVRSPVIVALVIVGGMHLHYSGIFDPAAGPEDPYLKGLAEHLVKKEALLYGAYW
jgi:uncharacterized membrane protein